MFVHPELAALRGDDAPQRRDQSHVAGALAAWREGPHGRELGDELARLSGGEALGALPQLSGLFAAGSDKGSIFAASLIGTITAALGEAPLAQVPLRHFIDDTIAVLMLARHGGVSLALQAIDGAGIARRPAPVSTSFSPGETWERVLAGGAEAQLVTLDQIRPDGAALSVSDCSLQAGEVHYRQGQREALQLRAVRGTLVSLKLQRRDMSGAPAREYRLDDGVLLHQAASSSRDSRLELATALLGRMGRSDAAPVLADIAEDEGSNSLRWQALRECLGLDTARGFQLLCTIARNPGDALAAPAGALRAQLRETYPQLVALDQEVAACPA